MGAWTYGDCKKWNGWSIRQERFLKWTYLIWAQPTHTCKVTKGVTKGWTSRKHKEHWQSIREQRQAKGFLKTPFARRNGGLLDLSRNHLTIKTGALTGHCHSHGHLFKLGMAQSPSYNWWRTYETASHVLCDRKALAMLRFRQPGHHFLKTGDFSWHLCQQGTAFCSKCGAADCISKGLR